ncbi:hypothetical protein NFJ02_26g59640 [Pycnococcus provasolii]|mmetsp:Transcript_2776/g.6208  ORF Transcript_2776/g.6208 Transcript_2776/m.6208 type:complete len:99 (-) Transcript_2776:82-378(-)
MASQRAIYTRSGQAALNQPTVEQIEYDVNVFPGYLRQPMGKWAEDGTLAPSGRQRGGAGKPDQFNLTLSRDEIQADVAAIEAACGIQSTTGKKGSRRK